MIRPLIFILFLIKTSFLIAQQPAYFVLGENQFKGLKVFDIIQDFNQNYYFATNEGLIKYDFIKYTKVDVSSAKSVAFFNLTINKYGVIYFNNLNNQIFSIKNGKCQLFYELTGDKSSNPTINKIFEKYKFTFKDDEERGNFMKELTEVLQKLTRKHFGV